MLRAADTVLVSEDTHPLLPALATADVAATIVAVPAGEPAATARAQALLHAAATRYRGVGDLTGRRSRTGGGDHGAAGRPGVRHGCAAAGGGAAARLVGPARRPAARRGRRHGPAALARRLPLGRAADAPQPGRVPRRGVVRGGRGDRDRGRRRRCARSSATCCCRCSSTPGSAQERAEGRGRSTTWPAGIVDKLVAPPPARVRRRRRGHGRAGRGQLGRLKAAEKGRESATDGIPLALPALVLAGKVLARAARAGVSVPLPAAASRPPPRTSWATCCWPSWPRPGQNGLDAEAALRAAVRRHRAAIRAGEGLPT